MFDKEYRAELDELVKRTIFLATADERYWALSIKPGVMRKRVELAVWNGESDISRLVRVALGEDVVVQFPFCGNMRMPRPPPIHRSWYDFAPS